MTRGQQYMYRWHRAEAKRLCKLARETDQYSRASASILYRAKAREELRLAAALLAS